MALSKSSYDSIMREYSKRRIAADKKASDLKMQLYNRFEELSEIDERIAGESVKASLAKIRGDDKALSNLKDTVNALRAKKEDIIKGAGYSLSDLEPKYTCVDCKDTGYIGDKKCHCFKQAELDMIYDQSRLADVLKAENFDNFNLDYYSKTKLDNNGVSAYDNAAKVLDICKKFCDEFTGHDNILLYGQPGIGKTYLTHCMAGSLLGKLHSVIYLTADELIKVFEHETFDKADDDYTPYSENHVLSSDVLIIDDLGTEFVNSFTSAKIFTCINERLLRGKSTIISTNLSLQELSEVYSERTFSRIIQFTILKLFGDDIRILKKAL